MRYVALLRSLNVGGHNRITMKDLASVFSGAGCEDVSTYIQSGNVVFTATAAVAKQVPAQVEATLRKKFDVTSPVLLRDAKQLARVAAHNLFLERGEETAHLHVGFLSGKPAAAKVQALDPRRSPPDEVVVVGTEAFFFFPNGVGRTRLTSAWLDGQLGVISTWRNWNTVLELTKRAADVAAPGA